MKIAKFFQNSNMRLVWFDLLRDDTAWQRQAQRVFSAFCWLEDRRWPRSINGL
jgi:hypothetical protein